MCSDQGSMTKVSTFHSILLWAYTYSKNIFWERERKEEEEGEKHRQKQEEEEKEGRETYITMLLSRKLITYTLNKQRHLPWFYIL